MRRALGGALLGAVLAASGPATADPFTDYQLQCQGCHGPAGEGSPGAVPELAGSVARFLRVPDGRAYLVRVPGSALSPLDDARLAAVLNWIVARFGPAADAAGAVPYDAAEVGRLRAAPLVEVEAARTALLQEIAAASR